MKPWLSALASGLIFGTGLCISGMTDPQNIIGFLDIAGDWRPNLAGVMLGALAVHASWLRWGARKRALAPNSSLPPTRARIDLALVIGAAVFGVGWGLAGYCPGPAIVALGSRKLEPFLFVGAMVLGMRLVDGLRGLTHKTDPNAASEPTAAE